MASAFHEAQAIGSVVRAFQVDCWAVATTGVVRLPAAGASGGDGSTRQFQPTQRS